MAKTYIPTLVKITRMVIKYVGRWYDTITENMDSSQAAALDALIVAANALLAVIELEIGD